MNYFSKHNIYFVPYRYSSSIKDNELHDSAGFKTTRLIVFHKKDSEGKEYWGKANMINESCIKLKVVASVISLIFNISKIYNKH